MALKGTGDDLHFFSMSILGGLYIVCSEHLQHSLGVFVEAFGKDTTVGLSLGIPVITLVSIPSG